MMQKPIILDKDSLSRLFAIYIYSDWTQGFLFDNVDVTLFLHDLINYYVDRPLVFITQLGIEYILNLSPSIILSKSKILLFNIKSHNGLFNIASPNIDTYPNTLNEVINKALNQLPIAEFPIYLADEYLSEYAKEVYDRRIKY